VLAILMVPATPGAAGDATVGPLPQAALALPAETSFVFGVKVKHFIPIVRMMLASAPLIQLPLPEDHKKLLAQLDSGLQELENKTGVRLERDVDELVFAGGMLETKKPWMVALVIGRVDRARLLAGLQSWDGQAGNVREERDGTLSVGGGSDRLRIAVTDRLTFFGEDKTFATLLENQSRGRNGLPANERLTALLRELRPGAVTWLAADFSGMELPGMPPWGVALGDDAETQVDGILRTGSEEDARKIAKLFGDQLNEMKSKAGDQPQLQAFLAMPTNVTAEGADVRMRLGPTVAPGAVSTGIVAAIAIPSLMRARVAANEAATIADVRSVVAAQAAYARANGGGYGELTCLAQPRTCAAENAREGDWLNADLVSLAERNGYKRSFLPGTPAEKKGALRSFAYTAVPQNKGVTGTRSFCGDSDGRVCSVGDGAPIEVQDGRCPQSCQSID
jgi:hypothetical protein